MIIPRLMIAAPASGSGKTTVATGLMAALTSAGLEVSPHKVGPDYIDPGYHALATGRPGRNLDAVLCGTDRIAALFAHGALDAGPHGGLRRADIAIVEGVMGLFDGVTRRTSGQDADHASTAHAARLLEAPVVLVVDASGAARSVAALVSGFRDFDPRLRLAGVVLNRVGSARHAEILREALSEIGMPVLGALPEHDAVRNPSRHLGLIPAAERSKRAVDAVRTLGDLVTTSCDLQALVHLARSAPPLTADAWKPDEAITWVTGDTDGTDGTTAPEIGHTSRHDADGGCRGAGDGRPVRVAMAGGAAFTFGYAEHGELLEAAGAEVVVVDPLTDMTLPEGTDALVIGGGFPEEHAPMLAANTRLRADVAAFAARGAPVVAECAGLLYLARSLDGHPMCGVVDVDAVMGPRLTLGYRHAVAATDSPVAVTGTAVAAHEFHRTFLTSTPTTDVRPPMAPRLCSTDRYDSQFRASSPDEVRYEDDPSALTTMPTGTGTGTEAAMSATSAAWLVDGRREGVVSGRVHASYLHLHWAGAPAVPARIVAAARTARPAGTMP